MPELDPEKLPKVVSRRNHFSSPRDVLIFDLTCGHLSRKVGECPDGTITYAVYGPQAGKERADG